jgi:DNA-binding CsgD family transcriptional regulator
MAQCITCGSELHPDRAKKYNYCMAPECQEKNLKGLTMVAIGVNKSAEQYMLLDEQTRDELASGKFADQRRGSFGTSVPWPGQSTPGQSTPGQPAPGQPAPGQPAPGQPAPGQPTSGQADAAVKASPAQAPQPARRRPAPPRQAAARAPRPAWTKSQERLALLYNEQGKRPEEIAQKLGLSSYTVSQIILGSRNRGKL